MGTQMAKLFVIVTLISGFFLGTSLVAFGQSDEGAAEDKTPPAQGRAWNGTTLRVITENDYPPFNYLDEEGVLTGFNVDLVKAICVELEVVCEIKTGDWDELIPSLYRGDADVVAASLSISVANLKKVDFTNRYFQMPARFASQKAFVLDDTIPEELAGEKIGVVENTAHEAYLKDFFYDAEIRSFKSAEAARKALKAGEVSLLFGDGSSLMFWVNGLDSDGCCTLRGGAFTESKYFGEGVGLAVRKGNRELRETLNMGLKNVRESGRFEELYLRYFPLRFY